MAEMIVSAPSATAAAEQAAAFLLDCCDCDTYITYPPSDGWPCPNICGKPIICANESIPLEYLATGYWAPISGSWSVGASKFSACAAGAVVNLLPLCGDPVVPVDGGNGTGIGCSYPFATSVVRDVHTFITDFHYADPDNPLTTIGDYFTQWEGDICALLVGACACEPAVPGQADGGGMVMGGYFSHTEVVAPVAPCFEPPFFTGGAAIRQCQSQFVLALSCHHATGRPVATLYFSQTSTTNSLNGSGSGTCQCVHEYVETVCAQPDAYSCAVPPVADEERTLTFSGDDWTASITFKFVPPI